MSCRILVFDDDKSICKLLKAALEAKGHEVTTFSNPTEFPFFNEKTCPCPQDSPCADILIADIVMPKMDGIEFLKNLGTSGCWPISNNNVAIISGYLTIHYMEDLNNLGFQYFRKPFQLQDIFSWVEGCEERIAARG